MTLADAHLWARDSPWCSKILWGAWHKTALIQQTRGFHRAHRRLVLCACHSGSNHPSAQVKSGVRGLQESTQCRREYPALQSSLLGVGRTQGVTGESAQHLTDSLAHCVCSVELGDVSVKATSPEEERKIGIVSVWLMLSVEKEKGGGLRTVQYTSDTQVTDTRRRPLPKRCRRAPNLYPPGDPH